MVGDRLSDAGERTTRANAFIRLADQHLDASYRLASAILGNPADAEDATHDALIQAWRHWSQLRDQARFEPWFDRIVVNTCRNRLRHNARRPTQDFSSELAVVGRDPFRQADDRDEMRVAIDRLSPDHRVVIALRYYLDLSNDEIAVRLGVPAGTVNSRLHYALGGLKRALQEAGVTGADR